MKNLKIKELSLEENDFEFMKEYTEYSYGREYQMKRYKISMNLLGVTQETPLEMIYGHYYALREWGDDILVEFSQGTNLSDCIGDLKRLYKVWQLGKYYCGQYSADEARKVFEQYKEYFNNDEFPKETHSYNYETQQQAAAELGLGVHSICFITRQDSELYITGPETVYTTPLPYGSVPVYVCVEKGKVSLRFANRYDQTFWSKALGNYEERSEFEMSFDRKEPQKFSLGKLTERKKHDWFSYIKDYTNEATQFFSKRCREVSLAEKKLTDAGFERIGESMVWRCEKGYFDCRATVSADGKIYTDISISYNAKVREEVFHI